MKVVDKMKIQAAIVGKTVQTFKLDNTEADAEAVTLLIQQARSTVNIYSKQLYSKIYSTPSVIEACHQFCMRSSRTRINILVDETRPITQLSHRLLSLSHRHSSSIFFKKTHLDYVHRNDEFCCVDRNAYFRLEDSGHYLASCNFSDGLMTGDLLAFFNDAWERSVSNAEFASNLL